MKSVMKRSPLEFFTTIRFNRLTNVFKSISGTNNALRLAWKLLINIAADIPLPDTSAIQKNISSLLR